METARRALPGLGALRAAQFAFIGPTGSQVSMQPLVLRAGKSVTFASVDVAGEGGTAARALLCFGAARESALRHTALTMPAVEPPEACPPLLGPGEGPAYLAQFEMRAAGPERLGGGGRTAEIIAWTRLRDPQGVDPTVALVTLGDASPPAPLALLDRVVAVSTMTWAMEFGTAPREAGGWRLLALKGEMVADGYAAERIDIWGEDGTPLLASRQSVAVFA